MTRTSDFIDLARAYVAALCRVYNEIGHHSYRETHLKDLRADFTRAIDMVLREPIVEVPKLGRDNPNKKSGDLLLGAYCPECVDTKVHHWRCAACEERALRHAQDAELKRVLEFVKGTPGLMTMGGLYDRLEKKEHRQ